MSVSEGVSQTERGYKAGMGDFTVVAGARYHPFSLRSILWQRKNVNAMNVFVEVVDGDRVYEIDRLAATSDKNFSWPTEDSPSKFDLVPPQRIQFRTTGALATEDQSVAINWAELGAP